MLIIISSALPIPGEAILINALFEEGLALFHLRKPDGTAAEIVSLIENIKECYHHKIALHQQHQIAKEYGINRLHFTGDKRNETTANELTILKEENHILSTSIHGLTEYYELSACFDYAFLGPVFNSISKEGYHSKMDKDFKMPLHQNLPEVIALGGIDATNIGAAMDMQFDGVAALGAIWQQPKQSINQFKLLQKAWTQTGR